MLQKSVCVPSVVSKWWTGGFQSTKLQTLAYVGDYPYAQQLPVQNKMLFYRTQQLRHVRGSNPCTPNCLHMTMILSLYLALWHNGFPTSSRRHKRGHAANSCDNSFMSFNWLSAANNWVKLRRICRSAKDSRLLPDMFSTSRWPCGTDR